MVCCCSLAGTAACRTCSNNPFVDLTHIGSNYTNTYTYTQYPSEWKEVHTPAKVKPTVQYWCDNCDSVLTPHQKYCHNCGKEIDWSDIFKDE